MSAPNRNAAWVDDGQLHASTETCSRGGQLFLEAASLEVGPVSKSEVAIRFALPTAGRVQMAVFDVAERRRATLESEEFPAGSHQRT